MKLTTIKLAASAPLLAIMLSACGGTDFSNQAFEDVNATSKALTERLEEVGGYDGEAYANRTQFADMQGTGQASYTGLAEMWINDDKSELDQQMADNETPDIIADLKLNADFTNNAVTGTLSNWVINQDPEYPMTATGEVTLANGEISGDVDDNANMSADLGGEIATTGDGPDETLTFAGNISGKFLGDAAEGAAGELSGTFSNPEDDESIPTHMSGTWGAEKDAAAE